jgi:hypothetical protein
MATVEVKVPQLSESVAEATLLQWKKKAGEAVAIDEILIEIETDKVVLEVPAPAAGVLAEILQADGATVMAEQVIARIDTEGKASAAASAAAKAAAAPPASAAAPAIPAAAGSGRDRRRGCRRGRRCGRLGRGGCSSAGLAFGVDPGNDLFRHHGGAIGLQDLGQHAGRRSRHLQHHLVGFDLDQDFIDSDSFAGLLLPLQQGGLGHRLGQLRDLHFDGSHVSFLDLIFVHTVP